MDRMDSFMNHRFLFFGKGEAIRTAAFDGFGIGPGPFSSMERRKNDATVLAIEEGDRIALIAAYFLERIEAHHGRFVEAAGAELMQAVRNRKELLDILVEGSYGLLGFKKGLFETLAILPGEENGEFSLEFPESPSLPDEEADKNEASQKGKASEDEKSKRERGKGFSHRL